MAKNEKIIPIDISANGFTTVQRYTSKHNARTDQLVVAQNLDMFNGIGKLQCVPGYISNGASAGGTVLGAHGHITSAGTGIPVRVVGTKIQYHNGTNWTDSGKTNLTAGLKAEFASFLDRIFIVNGTDIFSSADGNTWNSTQLTSAPTTAKFIDHYNSRLVMADGKNIWWSSLPDASLNITWNTTDYNVLPDPYDGDFITGLKRYRQRIMIFKNYSIHRLYIYGDLQPDVQPISETTGTPSGRSVILHDTGLYFFGTTRSGERGIFACDAEAVTLISRPIQDILDAVPDSQLTSICGGETKGILKWYLGDITTSDGTYIPKCEIRYSTYDRGWSWRSMAHAPSLYTPLKISTALNLYFPDSTGQMFKDETGSTFGDFAIDTDMLTNWIIPAGIDGDCILRKILIEGSNLKGITVTVQADEKENWGTGIDTVKDRSDLYRGTIKVNEKNLTGSKFRVRVTYAGSGPVIEKIIMHIAKDVSQL